MDIKEIKKKLIKLGYESAFLDDIVHDEMASMAADINNGGIEDQVRFLVEERGYTEEGIMDLLSE